MRHAYRINADPPSSRKQTRSIPYVDPPQERRATIEARLMAMWDGEQRISRIEELKGEVEAGTYRIDCAAIARRLLESPLARKSLGIGQSNA